MAISIMDAYHLKEGESEVTLNVTIGAKQKGNTKINIGGTNLGNTNGTFEKNLGKSSDLDGKDLDLVITCTDINPDSNNLIVTVELSGGVTNKSWTLNKTVKDKESYMFTGTIEFYQ